MTTTKKQKRTPPRAAGNEVTASYRVSDALRAVFQPLVPGHDNPHRFGGGRPRGPARQCADAIFYVSRTGWQWGARDATDLCPHPTAPDRFQEWVAAGVCLKLGQAGVGQREGLRGIDWRGLSMEGATTKAPRGGEKHRARSHRPGPKGRQTQPADRGPRGARGLGGGRGHSPRHGAG
jgi:putative transposase